MGGSKNQGGVDYFALASPLSQVPLTPIAVQATLYKREGHEDLFAPSLIIHVLLIHFIDIGSRLFPLSFPLLGGCTAAVGNIAAGDPNPVAAVSLFIESLLAGRVLRRQLGGSGTGTTATGAE